MTLADLLADAHPQPCAPFPRHVLDSDAWAGMGGLAESVDLMGLWADPLYAHALLHERSGAFALVSVPVAAGAYPSLAAHWPAAAWFERMIHDLWGHSAAGSAEQRPWLDHGRRCPPAPPPTPARRSIRNSSPPRASSTRFPSAPCMPASSSPGISASMPRGRRWCAWKSASASCTRARWR